jgi:uncharacterized protein YecE (DUF72 family)
MKFGRLDTIEGVDFRLPAPHPATAQVLAAARSDRKPEVFIGCSVWSQRGYVGRAFPPKTPQRAYLEAFGKAFTTVELNSTHYSIPRSEQVIKWREAVPSGFRFMPKVPQYISHRREPLTNPDALDMFIVRMTELEDRLGPILLQLPHHFGAEHLPQIEKFFAYWPEDMPLALEVRHADLLKAGSAQDELFSLMQAYGVQAVMSDVAGRRDALHMRLSTPHLLLRFNGHNLHPSDYQRLDAWVLRLSEWLKNGLQSLYVYMHQPEQGLNADTARYFIQQLNAHTGLQVAEPVWYQDETLF